LGVFTRATRNISRRKMRALLVIIALGFSMAVMISVPAGIVANQESSQNMASFLKGTMNNLEQEINTTADQIVVRNSSTPASTGFPGGGFPGGGSYPIRNFTGGFFTTGRMEISYINEKIVNASVISQIPGVVAVVPELEHSEGYTLINSTTPFGTRSFPVPEYTIEGVPLNSSLIDNYSILPTNVTEGRNLHENDTGVVLLSQNSSEYFGAGVSDIVSILGQNFKVVGIYEPSSNQTRDLYMNITDAQTLTNCTGEVSQFTVYAQNSSDVDAIVTAINDIPVSGSTLSFTDVNTLENNLNSTQSLYNEASAAAQSVTSQEQNTAIQDIAIAVVATSLIVLFVMLYTVRERTKEIGTLKAIGFGNWNVMSQFMLEGMLLSLGAGVVGVAIGSIGASSLAGVLGLIPSASRNSLFGSSGSTTFRYSPGAGSGVSGFVARAAATAVITPQLMLIALGAAILLGALGSLYPAWRASRTRPAEAMKYE
jgi:putative ABC transport system permease protein